MTVGEGVATPALVGDKLYVFARQEGGEITRCLSAADGKELWKDKYDALGATGPAQSYSGPRSSPTVASGKVVTLGVRGVLSCLNAADGKVLWRKDDFGGATPRFFTSSSPLVADGLCVAQLGGQDNGVIAAYDLATGSEKWKWTGDSPAYASPELMTVGGQKLIVAETEGKVLGLNRTDGKLVWETPFVAQRMGYNAATPVVDGQIPLTYIEIWLREKHDPSIIYKGSFIIHYVEKIVYINLTRETVFVLTVILVSVSAYMYLKRKK